ncbi:MAG: hypothetical protein WCG16_01460 [Methylococcales bacterium]
MISYRIFLFGFLSVSWFFLSGFDNPVATDTPINQAQKVPVEADSVAIKSLPQDTPITTPLDLETIVRSHREKRKKTFFKKRSIEVTEDNKPTKFDVLEKPLDLSIPLKGVDSVDLKMNNKKDEADQLNSFFESKPKKQQRSLELNGNFLMSPEPEAERRKTVDGAGISINVKPD